MRDANARHVPVRANGRLGAPLKRGDALRGAGRPGHGQRTGRAASIHPRRVSGLLVSGLACFAVLAGCATAPPISEDPQLGQLAREYIRKAFVYEANPAVRAEAIEASGPLGPAFLPLIRERLADPHPAVRFAACMELGKQRDRESLPALRRLLHDADPNVRIGVYFALERMGDASHRAAWSDALLQSEEAAVRRNAALALGQLEDPAVAPLLRRSAEEDRDEGVKIQSMEGLAKLGDQRAKNFFIRDAYGGRGYREPFALLTLGHIRDHALVPVLRSRLASSPYVEAQLAAARSLGRLGFADGFDLALRSLNWASPRRDLADDLPENQIMRVRTMAALALGAIGDRRALLPLRQRMETPDDPRVQLAAARAILMILEQSGTDVPPAQQAPVPATQGA